MEIRTDDYEKLGAFYLGRTYDIKKGELEDELLLYDSKDMVTHGCVLGMTGSGKTGLCMALLEEAALDNIPSIVIDPKGDIANIMLTFPDLAPEDFRPWINEDDASKKGMSPDEFAASQAKLWKNGLADWGQGPERIRALRDKVDMAVYTPGSSAGLPVSILSSLDVPEFEVLDDAELCAERIESTVSSILALIGEGADPIQDPEHILLSNIFNHHWRAGQNVDLETLIRSVQNPPFDKVGVFDLENFYGQKDRMALAMKMNNLLASPGFASWLEGEPLDIKRMMHTPEGKPRISIFSIAHLSDAERMFFVSLLLNQTLGWMRSQSGTNSLRALLYMDEIYGYLPPTAMPPSKKPLMTMLKQARAFGLGVLLATQNPVDLDYKALSNMGTWFLGRLQTERDKMRVLDGLEGAASEGGNTFDRSAMEQLLAGLGSRVFLMNNVHEDHPVVFHVRWVMSYLRGPLARRQIKTLIDPIRKAAAAAQEERAATTNAHAPAAEVAAPKAAPPKERPRLPKEAEEFFLPPGQGSGGAEISYVPAVIRSGEVRYSDAKKGLNDLREVTVINSIDPGSGEVDWRETRTLPNGLKLDNLHPSPVEGATFAELPNWAFEGKRFSDMTRELDDWLYANDRVTIYHSPLTGMYSQLGESEGDFRGRLVHAAHEIRDEKISELRKKYEKKIRDEEEDVERAMDKVAEQKAQASQAKMDTAMRIGGTILGAVFGRSVSTRSRSAMSGASRAWKEGRDVGRAEDEAERQQEELEEMEREAEEALQELKDSIDPMAEELEEIHITPYKKNCSPRAVGIVWLPYKNEPQPQLGAAW